MSLEKTDGGSPKSSDGGESLPILLGKAAGAGLLLGLLGLAIAVGITWATGVLWSPVGLIPAVAAGLGISWVVEENGGLLTGVIAVITGQGPVIGVYMIWTSFGFFMWSRADIIILLLGTYLAFKIGLGSAEEADPELDAEELDPDEVIADLDTENVDEDAVREILESDDPDLEELAALLEAAEEDGASNTGSTTKPAAGDGQPTD